MSNLIISTFKVAVCLVFRPFLLVISSSALWAARLKATRLNDKDRAELSGKYAKLVAAHNKFKYFWMSDISTDI